MGGKEEREVFDHSAGVLGANAFGDEIHVWAFSDDLKLDCLQHTNNKLVPEMNAKSRHQRFSLQKMQQLPILLMPRTIHTKELVRKGLRRGTNAVCNSCRPIRRS